MATCDSKGVIYVWVKYEGRWSIELINDRGICVSDFAWSHDGRMAVICYQDGFVLVGSVTGQRFWSHLYDLTACSIMTVTWTPNDLHLIFGLSNGSLMVVDENGIVLSKHNLKNDNISSLAYNCPKFTINFLNENNSNKQPHQMNPPPIVNRNVNSNLSASITNINMRLRLSNNILSNSTTSTNNTNNNNNNNINNVNMIINNGHANDSRINSRVNNNNYILACSFKSNGLIYLLKTYDDIDPIVIDTQLDGE